jgi:hypothetical protein
MIIGRGLHRPLVVVRALPLITGHIHSRSISASGSLAMSRPTPMVSATIPSIFSPLFSRSGLMFPAGSSRITELAQESARKGPERADAKSYLSALVELLGARWPKNRRVNIVGHGHSVPAGYFKTPLVDTFNARASRSSSSLPPPTWRPNSTTPPTR